MKEGSKLRSILNRDSDVTLMVIVTIVIFVSMASLRPAQFLRPYNFVSMGFQIPELGLYSLAMMMVMVTGGRDLSIVGIGNLACIVAALIMHDGYVAGLTGSAMTFNIIFAIAAALGTGVLCGLLNGIIVAYTRISSMLITMATGYIYTGIGIVITKGEAFSKIYPQVVELGSGTWLSVPLPLWLLIAALVVTAVIINRTRFGFEVKMVGSNPNASFYTGINNNVVLMKAYLFSGIMCAICGLEILARTDTAKADYAFTYTFQAILCAVLGATSPGGGFVKISCLSLSLISLQFLSSGFNMLRLGGYFKEFAWGLLLLIVLSINFLVKEYQRKRALRLMMQRIAK